MGKNNPPAPPPSKKASGSREPAKTKAAQAKPSSAQKGKGKASSSTALAQPGVAFDPDIFVSREAFEKFTDHFGGKPVVLERKCDLNELYDADHQGYKWCKDIIDRGWKTGFSRNGYGYTTLCAEFMSNFDVHKSSWTTGSERIVSTVRGAQVIVTPQSFTDFFNWPKEANPEFSYVLDDQAPWDEVVKLLLVEGAEWPLNSKQCKQQFIKPIYFPLIFITCSSILPLMRTSEVGAQRARLMHAILTGKRMDLAEYQFAFLFENVMEPKIGRSIPFGVFLTYLICHSGAVLPNHNSVESLPDIDLATMERSMSQYKGKRARPEKASKRASAAQQLSLDGIMTFLKEFKDETNQKLSSLQEESQKEWSSLKEDIQHLKQSHKALADLQSETMRNQKRYTQELKEAIEQMHLEGSEEEMSEGD